MVAQCFVFLTDCFYTRLIYCDAGHSFDIGFVYDTAIKFYIANYSKGNGEDAANILVEGEEGMTDNVTF